MLALLKTTQINENQARLLREGMEVLVGHLATVVTDWKTTDQFTTALDDSTKTAVALKATAPKYSRNA